MKKTLILFFALFLLTVSSVLAVSQNNGSNSNNQAVQNKNQLSTQNNGEEQELELQEQEELGSPSANKKNKLVDKKLNKVSDQVHQLLESRISNTGIGKEVREIAQNQEKAQEKIKNSYNNLNSRNRIFAFLFGPDSDSIELLSSELGENQKRIDKLLKLKTKIINKTDSQQLQETIDSMTSQNITLEEVVDSENKKVNLFGWLRRLFK